MIEKDPLAKDPATAPQATAAANAHGITKEDLEVVNMVKDQISGILQGADCALVPVTTIVNGKIFQAVEVMRRPKQAAIQPVKASIIKP